MRDFDDIVPPARDAAKDVCEMAAEEGRDTHHEAQVRSCRVT